MELDFRPADLPIHLAVYVAGPSVGEGGFQDMVRRVESTPGRSPCDLGSDGSQSFTLEIGEVHSLRVLALWESRYRRDRTIPIAVNSSQAQQAFFTLKEDYRR